MASKQNLKTHILNLIQAIFIALAILGFALQQLIANPTTVFITLYWFMFIMAMGVIMTGILFSVWMLIKYLIASPKGAWLL